MKRRAFIAGLDGALMLPTIARAQQPKIPRIGVLLVAGSDILGPLPQALRDLGYVESETIQIDMRSAHKAG